MRNSTVICNYCRGILNRLGTFDYQNSILFNRSGDLVLTEYYDRRTNRYLPAEGINQFSHCITKQKFEGPGNIVGQASFIDRFNDYRLTPCSIGVNQGPIDTKGLDAGSLDVDGNPRLSKGRIDMGAYEAHETLDVDIFFVDQFGIFNSFISGDGSSIDRSITSLYNLFNYQQCLDAGDSVVIAEGSYLTELPDSAAKDAFINMPEGIHVLGGYDLFFNLNRLR